MPNCQYANFDITILGTDPPYPVSAQFDGQSAEGAFTEQVDDAFWQEIVARLGAVHHPPGSAQIRAAGTRLFDSLIAGDIQRLWIRAETLIGSGGLRVRLAIQPPRVAALPWEALFDRDRNRLLAASGRTPLVRMETQSRYLPAPRPLKSHAPLNILVAAAEDPYGEIDVAAQQRALADRFAALPQDQVYVHQQSGRFSVVDLAQEIAANDIDLLHLISHGQADSLLLWHNDRPVAVQAGAVSAALERADSLRMVYLSACLAGRASERAAFTTVGPQLLQLGIPAVIAMQFAVSDADAIAFADMFYRELLSGPCPGAVDAAMGYARSSMYALNPDAFSFGTPVLWLNAADGTVFQLAPPATDATQASAPADSPAEPAAPVALPSEQELLAWLQAWTTRVEKVPLPPQWRLAWPREVEHFVGLVRQLQSTSNPAQKLEEIQTAQIRLRNMAEQILARPDDLPPTPDDAA